MDDEELKLLCDKALKRIMEDDQYFIHLLIQSAKIRAERLVDMVL